MLEIGEKTLLTYRTDRCIIIQSLNRSYRTMKKESL